MEIRIALCYNGNTNIVFLRKKILMKIWDEGLVIENGWEQSIQCLMGNLYGEKHTFPTVDLHYHEYIEFLYGIDGVGDVVIADKTYKMGPGDLIVINTREPHDVVHQKGETVHYLIVKFLPELLYAHGQSLVGLRSLLPLWQKEMRFSPAIDAATLRANGIHRYLDEIIEEFRNRRIGYELILEADILNIFAGILRMQRITVPENQVGLNSELVKVLEDALQLAETHYAEWTVQDAAKACNLSYSYFSRCFKQMFGFSFSSYLERLRLSAAERMLLTTNTEVSRIAAECGFGTVSYFIESFRKHYGTAPGAFRSKIRNNK